MLSPRAAAGYPRTILRCGPVWSVAWHSAGIVAVLGEVPGVRLRPLLVVTYEALEAGISTHTRSDRIRKEERN